MACECTTYECLEVVKEYNNCPTIVTLDLQALATGTYSWEYEFNGRWRGGSLEVTQGENIVLPYVFNEYYIHAIKLYDEAGALLNDTCYKLDTSKLPGTYTTTAQNADLFLPVTVSDPSGEGISSMTIAGINGRTIKLIVADPQVYTGFTQNGNTFTMTNGAVFYDGQKIVLVFDE